jgi:hypothetical protein
MLKRRAKTERLGVIARHFSIQRRDLDRGASAEKPAY